jgi:hypothetical protein
MLTQHQTSSAPADHGQGRDCPVEPDWRDASGPRTGGSGRATAATGPSFRSLPLRECGASPPRRSNVLRRSSRLGDRADDPQSP